MLFYFQRRDGDSNPGYPLGVYTLSRRASSTTRASLLTTPFRNRLQITKKMQATSVFRHKCILFFVLPQHTPIFIYFKISKLINFKVFNSSFEHSKHF